MFNLFWVLATGVIPLLSPQQAGSIMGLVKTGTVSWCLSLFGCMWPKWQQAPPKCKMFVCGSFLEHGSLGWVRMALGCCVRVGCIVLNAQAKWEITRRDVRDTANACVLLFIGKTVSFFINIAMSYFCHGSEC